MLNVNSLLATVNRRIDGTNVKIRKAMMSFVWNFDPRIWLFLSLYSFNKLRVIRTMRTKRSIRIILKTSKTARVFIMEAGDCC